MKKYRVYVEQKTVHRTGTVYGVEAWDGAEAEVAVSERIGRGELAGIAWSDPLPDDGDTVIDVLCSIAVKEWRDENNPPSRTHSKSAIVDTQSGGYSGANTAAGIPEEGGDA